MVPLCSGSPCLVADDSAYAENTQMKARSFFRSFGLSCRRLRDETLRCIVFFRADGQNLEFCHVISFSVAGCDDRQETFLHGVRVDVHRNIDAAAA